MVSSNKSKTTTVVTSSHRRESQTTQSPDSKTVQQTTLKEETTTVVTSSHKREPAGSNLSTKRPTQLSEIYVRQSDFEDAFMEKVRIQCDAIEKTIDIVSQACRKLIDKRFVKMKNKRVWYDRDTAALYPQHDKIDIPSCKTKLRDGELDFSSDITYFDSQSKILTIDGINFVLASPREALKTFRKGMVIPILMKKETFLTILIARVL